MVPFWFAYAPYAEEEFLARVLGRRLEGRKAHLADYRYVADPAYPHVSPAPGERVEGLVLATTLGDDWLLDDEFGVSEGYFRRLELEVESEEGPVQAWVMVGGPSLAWVLSSEDEGQEYSGPT